MTGAPLLVRQPHQGGRLFFPRLIGLDPGNERTGVCLWHNGRITYLGDLPNPEVRRKLRDADMKPASALVVEDLRPYASKSKNPAVFGMSLIRTAQWIGRFIEAWGQHPHFLIPRKDVVMAVTGVWPAGDPQVRSACIDKLGEPPTKAHPNELYPKRPAGDEWSAIAIVLAFHEIARDGRESMLESLDF